MYTDIIMSFGDGTDKIDQMIEHYNSVDIASVWSGTAYNTLTENLNKNIDLLYQQNLNLKNYMVVLELMEEYAVIDKKIESLQARLAACSGDDEESPSSKIFITCRNKCFNCSKECFKG